MVSCFLFSMTALLGFISICIFTFWFTPLSIWNGQLVQAEYCISTTIIHGPDSQGYYQVYSYLKAVSRCGTKTYLWQTKDNNTQTYPYETECFFFYYNECITRYHPYDDGTPLIISFCFGTVFVVCFTVTMIVFCCKTKLEERHYLTVS